MRRPAVHDPPRPSASDVGTVGAARGAACWSRIRHAARRSAGVIGEFKSCSCLQKQAGRSTWARYQLLRCWPTDDVPGLGPMIHARYRGATFPPTGAPGRREGGRFLNRPSPRVTGRRERSDWRVGAPAGRNAALDFKMQVIFPQAQKGFK